MKAETWMLYARGTCESCHYCHTHTDPDQDKPNTILICVKFARQYCIDARGDPKMCGVEANDWEPI
jgi:hypothetical protein